MKAIKICKNATKNYVENVKCPTPGWAKWLRNTGIVLTAVGTGIVSSPALFPAGIVTAAGYLILGGSISTAVFQGFKKSK